MISIAAGWLLLTGLLVSDAMGLASLIFTTTHWLETMVLLVVFFAITFDSLAMGTGVMLLQGRDTDPPRRSSKPARPLSLLPAAAKIRRR